MRSARKFAQEVRVAHDTLRAHSQVESMCSADISAAGTCHARHNNIHPRTELQLWYNEHVHALYTINNVIWNRLNAASSAYTIISTLLIFPRRCNCARGTNCPVYPSEGMRQAEAAEHRNIRFIYVQSTTIDYRSQKLLVPQRISCADTRLVRVPKNTLITT